MKIVVDVQGTSSAVAAPILDLRWRGAGAIDTTTRAGSLNPDDNYTDGATSEAAAQAGPGGSTDPTQAPLEGFSGGGPIQLITTTECPDGAAGPCPATAQAGGPGRTLGAPNWTAADGVSVSGVGGFGSGSCPGTVQGDCLFFGTSAATPHGAAVDAILREAVGGSPTVAEINARLALTAQDRRDAGFDNSWGAGILDAFAAVTNSADLRVAKDCVPNEPALAGQEWECTITVDNLGPSVARNVEMTDTHVSDGTFVFTSVTPSSGVTCSNTANPQMGTGTVTCTKPDLASSNGFTVLVKGTASQGQDINDTARVQSDTPDPDETNNEARDSVRVRAVGGLDLEKSDSPDPVIAGENLTYTIIGRNNGPSSAVNVVIEDFLPAEVSVVSVSSPGGTCNAGTPGDPFSPTTCAYGSIQPLGTRTMTIVVTVHPDTLGLIHNDAVITSETFDPDNSDNLATADTTVQARADLSITKTDSPATTVQAGRPLSYQLRVSNAGARRPGMCV